MADEVSESRESAGNMAPGGDDSAQKLLEDVLDCVKSVLEAGTRGSEQRESDITTQDPHSRTELSVILSQVADLVNHEKSSTLTTCVPDHYTHACVVSRTLSSYLALVDESRTKKLSACIKSDCSHWLSKLFSYENSLACFHESQWDGLARVCRLALHIKYPKFASEGFTALYTRPPVIYISAASRPGMVQYLCSQLGLPQSSVCKVPCNTMFGSPHTMDVAAFERLFSDDVSCGKTPLLLVANAGTPVAGHTDNLGRLRELCTQNGLWLHLEGDTLAMLALQIPASLKVAPSCDSMTLNMSKWFGLPGVPYCTFYRAKDPVLAEASGLSRPQYPDTLSVLPLWISIQNMGLNKMKEFILLSAQLAQPHCTSPVVVFRYRAVPSANKEHSMLSSQQQTEEQDPEDAELSTSAAPDAGNVSQDVRDAMNRMLAKKICSEVPSVAIDVIELPKEGCCLRFNPLHSARLSGTTSDHVEKFVCCLKDEIAQLDSIITAQEEFHSCVEGNECIFVAERTSLTMIGTFICIPQYWPSKELRQITEAKKMEVNSFNTDIVSTLCVNHGEVFSKGTALDGFVCINIEKSSPSASIKQLIEETLAAATELEDSSKFLEQMAEMVQKGIEAAEQNLVKDAEEQLLEEGLLRQVPLVGSLYSWWSPPPKESKIKGRSFNLKSGHLDTTDKTYKLHMQVQDDSGPASTTPQPLATPPQTPPQTPATPPQTPPQTPATPPQTETVTEGEQETPEA